MVAARQTVREKRDLTIRYLGGEGLAALTTASRNDRTAGTGTHTSTEAVNASTTTVVWLESTLALGHDTSLLHK